MLMATDIRLALDPALIGDQGEPPPWITRFPDRLADYRQAQELQRGLEKAAKR
jgi:hypothetical protein